MTDEQINTAVATALGWVAKEETNGVPWLWVRKTCDAKWESVLDQPNYCNDLNAMHEAEEEILKEWANGCDLWLEFTHHLMLLCSAHLTEHATARQRAEAFLKTVGKWEEVQK